MLQFKNKEGKLVMTENTETGEINVLSEELKDLQVELEEDVKDKDESEKEEDKENKK